MKYRDRLRVWETNYGRSEGWDLELEGERVAFMDESRWEDMFWVSYRLTVTTDDPALKERMMSEEFWKGNDWSKLVFRSRATGLIAEKAFPAGAPFVGPQRVNMRALYIFADGPRVWDWVVLKVRSLVRRK